MNTKQMILGAALLGCLPLSQNLSAQKGQRPEPTQEELQERKAHLLAEPFFKKAKWLTDYDEARKVAAAEGKLIFAYFTRSYAP